MAIAACPLLMAHISQDYIKPFKLSRRCMDKNGTKLQTVAIS